jgi:hypothetical protein
MKFDAGWLPESAETELLSGGRCSTRRSNSIFFRGVRVELPAPRECMVVRFEEAGPGFKELLVETLATIVSPGTEGAIFEHLNTVDVEHARLGTAGSEDSTAWAGTKPRG